LRLHKSLRAMMLLLATAGACSCGGRANSGSASDASPTTALGDAGCSSTQTISAACFDQSCVSDLDCVAVGQGSLSFPCEIECPSAAINKSALAAYEATVHRLAPQAPSAMCGCPEYGPPCCQNGQCSETCADAITDLDACAAAGGTCLPYSTLLEGGIECTRISYCTENPSLPPDTLSVCCPTTLSTDGSEGD
jgi:hypothetical protein